jgi:hypothetical protein
VKPTVDSENKMRVADRLMVTATGGKPAKNTWEHDWYLLGSKTSLDLTGTHILQLPSIYVVDRFRGDLAYRHHV